MERFSSTTGWLAARWSLMKIAERDLLPPEDVRLLDLGNVRAYLQARNWNHLAALGRGLVDVFERPEDRLAQAAIPAVNDLDDYDFVLARSLAVAAHWEGRPVRELYQDLLFYTDDVLHIGEAGPDTASGTISFPRVRDLLAGIRRTLLAAAHSVLRPQAHHARLQLAEADQFLGHCRFGQTRRGSFVLTITCPLDAVAGRDSLFNRNPFTRQVTAHLMTALQLLVQSAERDDVDAVLRTSVTEPVLSANLCEGLLELAPAEDNERLDVDVRWAQQLPPDPGANLPSKVSLTRQAIPFLENLADRLRAVRLTEARQFFFGSVETLDGRTSSEGRREGPVYVRVVDEEGDLRWVRLDLNADDHEQAIAAYRSNQLVAFRGVLRHSARVWRIDELSDFQVLARPAARPAS
jgi:hypothetical protein